MFHSGKVCLYCIMCEEIDSDTNNKRRLVLIIYFLSPIVPIKNIATPISQPTNDVLFNMSIPSMASHEWHSACSQLANYIVLTSPSQILAKDSNSGIQTRIFRVLSCKSAHTFSVAILSPSSEYWL